MCETGGEPPTHMYTQTHAHTHKHTHTQIYRQTTRTHMRTRCYRAGLHILLTQLTYLSTICLEDDLWGQHLPQPKQQNEREEPLTCTMRGDAHIITGTASAARWMRTCAASTARFCAHHHRCGSTPIMRRSSAARRPCSTAYRTGGEG